MPALTKGARLTLRETLCPFPLGLLEAGLSGTIVDVDLDAAHGNPIAYLEIDTPNTLDLEDGVLQIFRAEDNVSEVTADMFDEA